MRYIFAMSQEIQSANSKDLIKLQVQKDMNHFLSSFKDYSLGQKTLARRAGVHNKTIKRLSKMENAPGHITLLKIYSVLLGETNSQKLLSLLPQIIRESLLKDKANLPVQDVDYSAEIKREVLSNQVFCEIYFLIDAGHVSKDYIQFKFGEHGLHIIEKMHSLNAIKYSEDGQIELGPARLEFDTQVIKAAGVMISSKYSKPENSEVKGDNFLALYVESLPDQAYQEWLKIDKEAFIKKAEIAKKYRDTNKGKKVFTYMTTDTFIKGNDEKNFI